jgi:hypothetical protein
MHMRPAMARKSKLTHHAFFINNQSGTNRRDEWTHRSNRPIDRAAGSPAIP